MRRDEIPPSFTSFIIYTSLPSVSSPALIEEISRMARKASSKPESTNSTAAIGIEADIGNEHADIFRNGQHPDLRADYVIANLFFYPALCGTNFASVQHFIHYLSPQGMADFVLANGRMSSNQSGECVTRSVFPKPEAKLNGLGRQRDIRRALIEADILECMGALPDYTLWKFLTAKDQWGRVPK